MRIEQIDIEKETVRLREGFLKQILATSSGGLAILFGFYDRFLESHTSSIWFFLAIALWLFAICLSLFVQSILPKYFSDGAEVVYTFEELESEVERVRSEIRSGHPRNLDLLTKSLESLSGEAKTQRNRIETYFNADRTVKSLSYIALLLFFLGVVSLSIGAYRNV